MGRRLAAHLPGGVVEPPEDALVIAALLHQEQFLPLVGTPWPRKRAVTFAR